MSSPSALVPSRWTWPLQLMTALCSVVFLVGTTLQNFVVVDVTLIETMMAEAGGVDPAAEAPGFTTGFRIVGCLYMLGNALGILAFRLRTRWLFWVVLAVNLTQGLGFVMIPSQMWTAVIERYGVAGILPSAVTDGGAALLAVLLIVTLVRYRRTWAQLPVATETAPDPVARR